MRKLIALLLLTACRSAAPVPDAGAPVADAGHADASVHPPPVVVGASGPGFPCIGAGNLVYATGTTWACLDAGTTGQVLSTNGAAAPTWIDASTGGGSSFAPDAGDVVCDGGYCVVQSITGTGGQLIVTVRPPAVYFDPDASVGGLVAMGQAVPKGGTGDAGGTALDIVAQSGQAVNDAGILNNPGGDISLFSGAPGTGGHGGNPGTVRLYCGATDEFDVTPGNITMQPSVLGFAADAGSGLVELGSFAWPYVNADAGANGTPLYILAQPGQNTDGGQATDGGDIYIYTGAQGSAGLAGVAGADGNLHLGVGSLGNGDKIKIGGADGNVYFPGLSGSGNRCVHVGPAGQFGVVSGDCANPGATLYTSPFIAPPTIASATWAQVNWSGSTFATDDSNQIHFVDPGTTTSNDRRLLLRAAPSPPFTLTALIWPDLAIEGSGGVYIIGIVVAGAATAGGCHSPTDCPAFTEFIVYYNVADTCVHMNFSYLPNPQSGGTNYTDKCGGTTTTSPIWLQIHEDNSGGCSGFNCLTAFFTTARGKTAATGVTALNQFDIASTSGRPTNGNDSRIGLITQSISSNSALNAGMFNVDFHTTQP